MTSDDRDTTSTTASIERLDDRWRPARIVDAAEDHAHEDGEPRPRPARSRPAGRNGDGRSGRGAAPAPQNLRRRYKIQDVIRRRQVLLVQVVKEERGNKGAALTTYLSLAGRYCVLMPNTSHGGGISAEDLERRRSQAAEVDHGRAEAAARRWAASSAPPASQRTKVEIKRDFDYLARLWDGIRETTLSSAAPALVYGTAT